MRTRRHRILRAAAASNSTTNRDTIAGFNVDDDVIELDNAIFTALGTPGPLASSAFYSGVGAHDANDRVIYNSTSGALLYDVDGTSAGAAVQFATLSSGLALTSADFLVI